MEYMNNKGPRIDPERSHLPARHMQVCVVHYILNDSPTQYNSIPKSISNHPKNKYGVFTIVIGPIYNLLFANLMLFYIQ